jgi:hypothetical protein
LNDGIQSLKNKIIKLFNIYFSGGISFGEAAYFNGDAHFCNTATTHCYVYDPEFDVWTAAADLDSQHILGGFGLVPTEYYSRYFNSEWQVSVLDAHKGGHLV